MRILLVFVHVLIPFRLEELDSICQLLKIRVEYDRAEHERVREDSPFMWAEFESAEDARRLVERSLSIRVAMEVWGHGEDYPSLLARVAEQVPVPVRTFAADDTFKFEVHGFGASLTQPQKVERINTFGSVLSGGRVDLKSPRHVFWLFEDFGLPDPKSGKKQVPRYIYFGRQLGVSAHNWTAIDQYDLKKRRYLGTTSMRAELSFLCANQALARKGSLVLDPFVGTGSLLIGCAHFGALTFGSDIDGRVLRGTVKPANTPREDTIGTNVFDNFRQYNLWSQLAGLVVQDNAHTAWRSTAPIFDAIVCDPPYGVRAGAKTIRPREFSKKSSSKKDLDSEQPASLSSSSSSSSSSSASSSSSSSPPDCSDCTASTSSPKAQRCKRQRLATEPCVAVTDDCVASESAPDQPVSFRLPRFIGYNFGEVLIDLLNFSLVRLVVGGRLVFWIPANHSFHPDELPTHHCLRFVASSMQKLTRVCARVLVTFEKIAEFDASVDSFLQPIPMETLVNLSFANFGFEYFGEESTRIKLTLPTADS